LAFGYVPSGMARGLVYRIFGAPNFLRRLQWPAIADLLALEPGHVVLDLGCGDLQLSAELAKRDVRAVIATDASPRLVGRSYVARQVPRLRLVRADGGRLPLANACVDRVLASSILQMVPNPGALLAECRRVLKPGGRLVLTVPDAYRYFPRLSRDKDTREELNRMFGVEGKGYLSEPEVSGLLATAGFKPVTRAGGRGGQRIPGPVGTFLWEASLALTYRLGDSRLPMLLAFAFYPLGLLDRLGATSTQGGELLMAATTP
jgi:SAM-dependent methyltransferase